MSIDRAIELMMVIVVTVILMAYNSTIQWDLDLRIWTRDGLVGRARINRFSILAHRFFASTRLRVLKDDDKLLHDVRSIV